MKVSLTRASIEALRAEKSASVPTVGQIIRTLAAQKGMPLTKDAVDQTVLKALSTGNVPGSYLVPTESYNQLIPALSRGGKLRAAGATVIPLTVAQKIEIPVEGAVSDDETIYLNENAQVTAPITPNIEQRSITLKQMLSLFEASANLARVSKPAFDLTVEEIMTRKAARGEDFSFFAGKANGPISLPNRPNVDVIGQAGANLDYTDITGMMEAGADSEDEIEKFVFFVNGKTLNLLRKLKSPAGTYVLRAKVTEDGTAFSMFGHRVFVTPAIPSHVGSGNASSYIAFLNPANVLIGDGGVEIAIADDGQYFDRAVVGVRLVCHREYELAHPEAAIVLENVR